jgi:DNA repair exonuclease SbcCD ATPase subunit
LKTEHKCLTAKLDHLLARPESEFGNDGKAKKEAEIAAVKKDIDEVASKIEHEKGWLAKNSNFDRQPAKCCNCGFKDIGPSDNYCQECGVALCDKAKKSDLVQENHALRQQLAAVQKQLLEVLTRLEKLEGKDSKKLAQKLSQVQEKNQALIQGDSSPTEIQNQLEQSHNLLNQARADSMISGSSVDNTNDKKANAAAPYLIGGGSLLLVGGLITYYCLRSKRKRL